MPATERQPLACSVRLTLSWPLPQLTVTIKLSQLKLSLHDKLETLKLLDSEIVELTPEEGLENEIEQADRNKENVYRTLTMIAKVLKPTPSPRTPVADTHAPTTSSAPPVVTR